MLRFTFTFNNASLKLKGEKRGEYSFQVRYHYAIVLFKARTGIEPVTP